MGNDCVFGCFILKEKETKIDFRAEVQIGSQVNTSTYRLTRDIYSRQRIITEHIITSDVCIWYSGI